MKKIKKMPRFRDENHEREFWRTHDSSDYVDWKKANVVLMPNLKPSVRNISLRMPESMLEELKILANKRDVPYQSLMKVFLSERIHQEFGTV